MRKALQNSLNFWKEGTYSVPCYAVDIETEGLGGKLTHIGVQSERNSSIRTSLDGVYFTDAIVSAYNGIYDIPYIHQTLKGVGYVDALAGLYVYDERECWPKVPKLDEICAKLFKAEKWGSWSADMTEEELRAYLGEDIRWTYELTKFIWTQLQENPKRFALWTRIESPMAFICGDMERRGVRLDRALLEKEWTENRASIQALRETARTLFPEGPWDCPRCNGSGIYIHKKGNRSSPCSKSEGCGGSGVNSKFWNSGAQLGTFIYETLGFNVQERTASGLPSTSASALLQLLNNSGEGRRARFLEVLLGLKERTKLDNGFYTPYMESGEERVHPSWWPWQVATGRFACSKPNMMQVPAAIRHLFIPDEGYAMSKWDYSQLEYYLLGVMSGETFITENYEAGKDVHQATAELVGIGRDHAKTYNYGVIYGLTPYSIANRLGITKATAKQIHSAIMAQIPRAQHWMERQKDLARSHGYVETLLGRRRHIDGIHSDNDKERFSAQNRSVNSPIQGTAADLMKTAQIYAFLEVPEAQPLMQVHDELVCQVPLDGHENEHHEAIGECLRTALAAPREYQGREVRVRPGAEGSLTKAWQK